MRNLLCAVAITVFLPLSINAQDKVSNYINTYQHIAIDEMHRSGIPASITLAQGMFESAYGESPSAISYNNHFGIKCKKEWTGPYFFKHDDDRDENGKLIPSCFRAYASANESFADHTNFLVERERYQELFTFHHTDYHNWAKGLQRCGYATNPTYANKLIAIIERYALWQFDQEVSPVLVSQEIVEQPSTDQSLPPVATDAFAETQTDQVETIANIEEIETVQEAEEEVVILEQVVGIGEVVQVGETISQVAKVDSIVIVNIAPKKPVTSRVNQAIILPANYTRRGVTEPSESVTKMK